MRLPSALALCSVLLLAGCSPDVSPVEPVTDAPPTTADGGDPRPDPEDEPAGPGAEDPEGAAPDDLEREAVPIRAVWVHLFDDTLKSAESIQELVDEVRASGANTIIAQVARRHDAYYASAVLPRTTDPALEEGLDVLQTLLEAAEPVGLHVHAWVSVAPTWHASYETLDQPTGWLAAEHGLQAPVEARWVTRSVDGVWTEYLDVALPEVVAHVVDVAEELAREYPIDGVHLDYVRYEDADRGYHPRSLARFAAETATSGVPAPDDPVWSDWRRDQTHALMVAVRDALDATGTGVELSAPVITWGAPPDGSTLAGTRTHRDALQEWDRWARDGVVDVLYPMNYFREHDPDQAAWFAGWIAYEEGLAAATDVLIAPGIGGWINLPDAVVDQVRAAMAATGGAAVYSYQQPTDGDRQDVFGRLAESDWGAAPVG
jgi:uncharacterized lipoprotein YddW (UPF0748 family)